MTRLTSAQRKMLASTAMLTLVCLAWLTRFRPWGWWGMGAIVASWLADGLLARYPPVLGKVPGGFFIGAGFFALAHACYGAASVMVLRAMGLPFRWLNFSLLVAAFALAVGFHAWLFARSSKRATGFTAAACAYLMVGGRDGLPGLPCGGGNRGTAVDAAPGGMPVLPVGLHPGGAGIPAGEKRGDERGHLVHVPDRAVSAAVGAVAGVRLTPPPR